MATPGTTIVHQASCQDGLVSWSMRPQLGLLALETPRPRKLIAASIRIATPIWTLAITMIGAATLGRTCRHMMRTGLLPTESAASMNC